MPDVIEYCTEEGVVPFEEWFEGLDRQAALKVRTALAKIEDGNLGDVKPVGGGVSETRIRYGPGFPRLHRQGRRPTHRLAGRRHKETPKP